MKKMLSFLLFVSLAGCSQGVGADSEQVWRKIGKDLYEAKIPNKPIWCYSQNQDVYQSAISCVRY